MQLEKKYYTVQDSETLKLMFQHITDSKVIAVDTETSGLNPRKDKIVGWSISLCSKLENHKQFGNMNLGSIIDCLSAKGYETSIIKKTEEILKKEGADLIVSNQSHVYWKNALKVNSFIKGPSNFIFASSVELTKKLGDKKKFIHLTRGDGDGPINL